MIKLALYGTGVRCSAPECKATTQADVAVVVGANRRMHLSTMKNLPAGWSTQVRKIGLPPDGETYREDELSVFCPLHPPKKED